MIAQPSFTAAADYAACFTDAAYWQQLVEMVCRRHDLPWDGRLHAGMPGTFPVFIVGTTHVVKLYGDLFDGPAAFAAEAEALRLIAAEPRLPVPRVLARGHLFDARQAWSWPYLVTSFMAGTSLGEAAAGLAFAALEDVARTLGSLVAMLHRLPLPATGPLRESWESFQAMINLRRGVSRDDHARWDDLPAALVAQVEGYLLPDEALFARRRRLCLLHADLNADHLLGHSHEASWQNNGIIDFSDARVGDPLYELVALHLGLFHGDKRLLRAFLRSYGPDLAAGPEFTRRAMTYTLLFAFGLGDLRARFTVVDRVTSLATLERLLWDLNSPGLADDERE